MPFFNTGNAQWDQGFNTLGGALFPDPSKIGQATYYGAEARKAQIDAAKQQEQLAAGHRQLNMVFGQAPGQPNYSGTGPLNIPILSEPPAMGGGGGGPPPGPAPGPAPAAPPPPTAAPPPAPGPVGSNMPPGALSALFAQGGGAVPSQPQWVPQTMSPAAAAQTIATKLDAQPNATSGASPPASPPAPGTPPAPNTTGSDGSTPPSRAEGVLHPGSLTPQGGGVKMSGPAAADGSPAPAAFNLAQYVALGTMHGLPADQALAQGRAVIAEWVKNGQMDQRTADNIVANIGVPDMRTTAMREEGATQRTAMTEAGATQRTGMTIGGENYRAGLPTTFVPDLNNPGQGRWVPLSQQQGGNTAGANPQTATQAVTPVDVQPGGPGTPVTSQTQAQAQRQGTPLYKEPTSDQSNAAIQRQIMAEPDPAKRQALIERLQQASPRPPPTSAEVYAARQLNYQADQENYPMPQKPPVALHITAPVALDGKAQAAVDARAQNLMDQNRRLDLATAHQQAVNQLQDEGTLYTSDEVNKMREGTAANLYGRYDAQIRLYNPPGGKPSEHLMIGLKPKGQQQPVQPQRNQPPVPQQPPPVAQQPPAPVPQQPPAKPLSSVILNPAQRTGTEPLPVVRPVVTRDPAQANSPLARGAVPQPVVPPQSQVSPTQMQTSDIPAQGYGGMPSGAAGPAPPGTPDGTPGVVNSGPYAGRRGVVRGGWVYPVAAASGGG